MDEKNLDIYGNAVIPWSRALEALEAPPTKPGEPGGPKTYWLGTSRPDQRPHVAGVGALWVDGKFYFVSGPGTRKSRNLARGGRRASAMAPSPPSTARQALGPLPGTCTS